MKVARARLTRVTSCRLRGLYLLCATLTLLVTTLLITESLVFASISDDTLNPKPVIIDVLNDSNINQCSVIIHATNRRPLSSFMNGFAHHYWTNRVRSISVIPIPLANLTKQIALVTLTRAAVNEFQTPFLIHNETELTSQFLFAIGDERCEYHTSRGLKLPTNFRNLNMPIYSYYNSHFAQQSSAVYLPIFWRVDMGAYIPIAQLLTQWKGLFSSNQPPKLDYSVSGRHNPPLPIDDRHFKLSSERQFIANSVFTVVTNFEARTPAVDAMKNIQRKNNELREKIFFRSFDSWEGNSSDPRNAYLNAQQYKSLLLNSVFTIAPLGNNPETFRMWEAIGMGSIPIVVLNRKYFRHSCADAFHPIIGNRSEITFTQISNVNGSMNNVIYTRQIKTVLSDGDASTIVDRMKGLIERYPNTLSDPFVPIIVLKRWSQLKPFLKKAIHINWDLFQSKMLVWWDAMVEERFMAVFDKLVEEAPFCN